MTHPKQKESTITSTFRGRKEDQIDIEEELEEFRIRVDKKHILRHKKQ